MIYVLKMQIAQKRQGLQDKTEELTREHENRIAQLRAKATEDQARKDLTDYEQSEREKINGTQQGSAERLAATDAAIKDEQSRNLQDTARLVGPQGSALRVPLRPNSASRPSVCVARRLQTSGNASGSRSVWRTRPRVLTVSGVTDKDSDQRCCHSASLAQD
ncbi:MAG: hypothetical protein JWQ49_3492 [Edaphobacter sp.]|nr:hypothetical protein [Edaphobacter sp.]